jgi:pimeloyl-ACP methyl ester carboxylesterase
VNAAVRTLVDRFDPESLQLAGRENAIVRLDVDGDGTWDAVIGDRGVDAVEKADGGRPDALLRADAATWKRVVRDLRGGMAAFRSGRLTVRHDLALGVGFLAATTGSQEPGRLRFRRVGTPFGDFATMEAGEGPPLVMLHGLGGTKTSFLPTVAALAERHRLIAVDLPGFGDSDKPIGDYDAPFFAQRIEALLDALQLPRTHLLGHSLGGRVAIEVGHRVPSRIDRLILLTPSMAWLQRPWWAPLIRPLNPKLGLIQPAPRPVVERIVRRLVPGSEGDGWLAVGVDEFLRAYLDKRGRAAFYASARNILLEDHEPFWTELRSLSPRSLFVWGHKDPLVPIAFQRHVREALPAAEHVELDCGHVPQIERPEQLHRAIAAFLQHP